MNNIKFLKYFDHNKVLENANVIKEFTNAEKCAIIIASETVALDEKIEDLRNLELQGELKQDIERWIDLKERQLDFVKKFEEPGYVFVLNIANSKYPKVFKNYSSAMKASRAGKYDISVEEIDSNRTKAILKFNPDNKKLLDVLVFREDSLKLDKPLSFYNQEVKFRLFTPEGTIIFRELQNDRDVIVDVKELE